MSFFSFKRPQLASAYCDSLQGKGIANARSGLFLAAPRRVGKTTFLLEELMPEADSRGWSCVYVDLWSDKNKNPGILIAEAIKNKIKSYESKFHKVTSAFKLEKIQIAGALILDFKNPGLPDNMTLTDAFQVLANVAQKPIVLVVDEAQHAITTKEGINTMFALKSARDTLNTNHKSPEFMLVFTGSNQDKLGHLLVKKGQPFFGSDISAFPLLTKEYTDKFTAWVNDNVSKENQFSKDSMWAAFTLLGNRPEILRQVIGRIAISGQAKIFDELLITDTSILNNQVWVEFENEFTALNPLQQALLMTLVDKGRSWAPFGEESIKCYKTLTGKQVISTATVQSAIEYLREKDFIWQSGRGSYALEDESFADWLKCFKNKNEMEL